MVVACNMVVACKLRRAWNAVALNKRGYVFMMSDLANRASGWDGSCCRNWKNAIDMVIKIFDLAWDNR